MKPTRPKHLSRPPEVAPRCAHTIDIERGESDAEQADPQLDFFHPTLVLRNGVFREKHTCNVCAGSNVITDDHYDPRTGVYEYGYSDCPICEDGVIYRPAVSDDARTEIAAHVLENYNACTCDECTRYLNEINNIPF